MRRKQLMKCWKVSRDDGIEKNITEYSSWEEVYADLGITMKENTRTAEELRADGFEVCENADGTFIAFKDYAEESAEVQEEFKPVALRAVANALMKTTNTSLAREGGVSGITGGFAFIDVNGNEIDYNGEAAGNFDQESVMHLSVVLEMQRRH